ncbi:hypothetical protein B296_00007888 [Ensete ventricosum]|uniref:Uncharacterized protein n=1 Tax=Ensete ventricosum TaxID=4639 RepID=A0A426Z6F0_ENSVE|nr:hypothetical protein B296_00007888 [Ensete ventricosum]
MWGGRCGGCYTYGSRNSRTKNINADDAFDQFRGMVPHSALPALVPRTSLRPSSISSFDYLTRDLELDFLAIARPKLSTTMAPWSKLEGQQAPLPLHRSLHHRDPRCSRRPPLVGHASIHDGPMDLKVLLVTSRKATNDYPQDAPAS